MAKAEPYPEEIADTTVFARVVRHHILRHAGVARMCGSLCQRLRRAHGVSVRIDRQGKLHIRAKVVVFYGYNLHTTGLELHQAVAEAVHRLSDRPIGRIDLRIVGIKIAVPQNP